MARAVAQGVGKVPFAQARIVLDATTKVSGAGNGDTVAFQDVNLSVCEGELLCVLGPSGCGKSTLLNFIVGLDRLSGGSVAVGGEPVAGPHCKQGMVL